MPNISPVVSIPPVEVVEREAVSNPAPVEAIDVAPSVEMEGDGMNSKTFTKYLTALGIPAGLTTVKSWAQRKKETPPSYTPQKKNEEDPDPPVFTIPPHIYNKGKWYPVGD